MPRAIRTRGGLIADNWTNETEFEALMSEADGFVLLAKLMVLLLEKGSLG